MPCISGNYIVPSNAENVYPVTIIQPLTHLYINVGGVSIRIVNEAPLRKGLVVDGMVKRLRQATNDYASLAYDHGGW